MNGIPFLTCYDRLFCVFSPLDDVHDITLMFFMFFLSSFRGMFA